MNFKLILLAAVILLLFSVTPGCIEDGKELSKDVGDNGSYQEPEEIKQINKEPGEINPAGNFQREFAWSYGGYSWSITMEFSPETYEIYKSRSRHRDYDLFVSDPYDDGLIRDIVSHLKETGKDAGFDDNGIAYLIVSFVQSLPYTSDDVTTGFDEYPRFPYETLYDDGGDCEDTSILVSALLQETGYDVVLIKLPGHVAAGIKCSEDFPGAYYNYSGQKYCYLETTGENWPIGKIPDEYKNQEASIIPVYKRPFLDVDFTAKYKYNSKDVYVDVNVSLKNLGSKKAENTKLYVALQTSDTSKAWDSVESEYLRISPEAGYGYYVKNLHAPAGKEFRIYVRAYGDNVISDEAVSDWVIWK